MLAALIVSLVAVVTPMPEGAPARESRAVARLSAFVEDPSDGNAAAVLRMDPRTIRRFLGAAMPFQSFVPKKKRKGRIKLDEDDFYLYDLPDDYDPAKSWPMIVTLHGTPAGHVNVVHDECWRGESARNGYILLSPNHDGGMWHRLPGERMFIRALYHAVTRFHVDWRRIYLDGYSSGGIGVWSLGTRFADIFAAITVRCGFPLMLRDELRNLRDRGVFVLHGKADMRTPIGPTERTVAALKRFGVKHEFVKFKGRHGCYPGTNPRVMEYLSRFENEQPESFRLNAHFHGDERLVHYVSIRGGRHLLEAERSEERIAVQVSDLPKVERMDVFFSASQLEAGRKVAVEVNGTVLTIVPTWSASAFVRSWRLYPFYTEGDDSRVFYGGCTVVEDGEVLATPRPL